MIGSYWRIVIRPNMGKVIVIGVLSLLVAMAEIATIGLVIPVVAYFSGGESQSGQRLIHALETLSQAFGLPASPARLLFMALVGIAACILVKSLLAMGLSYLTAFLSQSTKRALTIRMFGAFANARYHALTLRSRGEMAQDIQGPPDTVGYVIYISGQALAAVGQLGMTLVFLFWLSPQLTLLIGTIGGVMAYVFRRYFQKRVEDLGRTDYALEQRNTGLIVEALDGIRVVKVHGLAGFLQKRLGDVLSQRLDITVRMLWFHQTPRLVFELGGILIVVMLVALSQLAQNFHLDFPALAAFVLAMRQVTPSASNLNTHWVNIVQNGRKIQVIEETLARLPQEDTAAGIQPVPDVIRTLRLESLTFTYPENPDRAVFKDLSLTFTRGRVTALVGGTGAGKTTLADLIIRLQEPGEGRITADDVDIRRFSLAAWRKQIGYVGQDIFLFNAPIAENIAALDDRVPHEEIVRVAQLAQIHEFIAALPGGYNTLVGDRGVKLSGGQRQRIAVARAILRRPQILILDEATSALDTLTERALHTAIDFIRREAIVILIAHRLSTVVDADEIVVLQDGQVVEKGTHESLLAKRGQYWRFHGAAREPHSAVDEQTAVLEKPAE